MLVAIDDDQLFLARTWITWEPPSDDDLHAAHDRHGLFWQVIVDELRRRRQRMIDEPASFTIPGDYHETSTIGEQIKALSGLLASAEDNLSDELGSPVGSTPGRIVRQGSGWQR